jgi:pimeloyl-ACP methyl ester carboxylesterase
MAAALVAATLLLKGLPRSGRPRHQAEWLAAGDARVRALRAGRGDTTLFLIHGFGESLFTWRAVLDPLAERYRVFAIDLPGFGGSQKPEGSYSLEVMTGRLVQLVDHTVPGTVIAIGHSMGGQLAAALALARPERIAALVLVAPAGWSVGLGGIADTMYPSKARAIGWYLSSRAFLLPEHDPDWLGEPEAAAAYSLVGDAAYRRSTARVLEEFDFRGLRDRFAQLTQPTLLIWGTLDPVIPYAVADSIAGVIPCRRLVALPNALHRPQVEVPDTVIAEIQAFVARPAC